MQYKVIFTSGWDDDIDSLSKGLKSDVLILDSGGSYYNPQFITLERIANEFDLHKNCYLEDNLVILHAVTKESILKSIPDLHNWKFSIRWTPLTESQLEYFLPIDDWKYFHISI